MGKYIISFILEDTNLNQDAAEEFAEELVINAQDHLIRSALKPECITLKNVTPVTNTKGNS